MFPDVKTCLYGGYDALVGSAPVIRQHICVQETLNQSACLKFYLNLQIIPCYKIFIYNIINEKY